MNNLTIERNNKMDALTNAVTAIISKPTVGITAGIGGGLSSILTAIGILGPIIGFAATMLGFVVALIHLRIALRKWREHRD